ncbi:MarR family winged helix-turn-helix transcriptional regulator [Chromobacterium sp. IIBBL 290-4]|uniref:MarR family winged helix-turn-helix transcriptional regulator n=1 Tax=Chromobacterium sp. IIBBL 290-4 TaxID=2953890 RepID=UPI0020B7D7F5|nr:MarR family transcriptional regulator [Chromobacterium sp. IIBBL 290-4]UTH73879.1 MarR family transcriptional regulator [Chromobacterium sp. IIBBL 290-4]
MGGSIESERHSVDFHSTTPSLPAAGEGKRGVDGHIGYLLRQAAGAHHLRMERALADLAVTPPQFVVMTMLAAYPGLSNADLARLALLTPQTVNAIVANLKRAGRVESRPHASHGRILQLELTEDGGSLLAQCRERVEALERAMLAHVPADDESAIRRWLAQLAATGQPGGA